MPDPRQSQDTVLPVAVLGAGITGLSAAWHLRRAGIPVRVFEADRRPGGMIVTGREAGWLHDIGPNTLLEGTPEVAGFIDAIGLGPRRLEAAQVAKKRYIVRGGRLLPLPGSPRDLLTTGLFSWGARLRLLGEPFRRRGPAAGGESVADFAVRRLGREFLDYAVNPFVSGVFAGDPRRLSMGHAFPRIHAMEQAHGSLLRAALRRPPGARRGIYSFPDGMEELPQAVARAVGPALLLEHRVKSVGRTGGPWMVDAETPEGRRQFRAAAVVCALPAGALASLEWTEVPEAHRLRLLGEIEHPPVASVFTGFRREDVAHPLDGFGLLVPGVEGRRILGTLFSSSMFPGRAPPGHVALTTFVGGATRPELPGLADGALLDLVGEELVGLVGLRRRPVWTAIRRWPRAMPQYGMDHAKYLDACAAVEAAAPGLHIGGNFRDGISLGNCIESGRRLAAAAGPR